MFGVSRILFTIKIVTPLAILSNLSFFSFWRTKMLQLLEFYLCAIKVGHFYWGVLMALEIKLIFYPKCSIFLFFWLCSDDLISSFLCFFFMLIYLTILHQVTTINNKNKYKSSLSLLFSWLCFKSVLLQVNIMNINF